MYHNCKMIYLIIGIIGLFAGILSGFFGIGGGIVFVPEKKVVIKCDLCDGDPVCVKFCPTGAIKYEEPVKATLAKRREKAEKVWETLT